ncbi:GYDIA family GHMP kinase [Flavobacterium sp. 3HN19-14]|uniref:GYDIA family GHMP kinase n=1 Tax=Flavobacterium sp. 3HN19-14 TaxID=3448133 RepID=UPI003EE3C89D
MKKSFYSNGKLMITAEYAALDGANVLALPTKKGQNLVVEAGSGNKIYWKSFDADGSVWFEDNISFPEIINNAETENPIKNTLIKILHDAYRLNPDFIDENEGYKVETHLTFPRFWGLGTSSTLINNIAQWLEVDAFALLKNSFGGSGYDLACAQNSTPIVYHLENGVPKTEQVPFNPTFKKNIWFVYLNQKQSSKSAIAAYKKKHESIDIIPQLNELTSIILNAMTQKEFESALQQHEMLIGEILEIQPVKSRLFPDFHGTLKSLGAWGGDFIMAVSTNNPTAYFHSKGYKTIIPYDEMI